MAAKPTTNRGPWYRPARIVWQLPWLGSVFASATIFGILAVTLIASIPGGGDSAAAFAFGYGLGFAWGLLPNVVYLGAFAMVITSAVLFFGSFAPRISARVSFLYKSLPPSRRKLNIALWLSVVGVMVFQFIPFTPSVNQSIGVFSINSRYSLQILDLFGGVFAGYLINPLASLIYISAPIAISLSAALAFSYALFMFLLMTTLRPSSALLLKRIFYIFALALATVAPLGIVPAPIGFGEPNFSFYFSQLALFNLLAPVFLLLAVSLVWLYFQRARLAALGARVKTRVCWTALGGVALQVFYLVVWSVFSVPNLIAGAEFFYVGSVLLAAFLIVAWFGLLLMVGARRKWDWALFGLVAATQIASLIVVYPGLLTA